MAEDFAQDVLATSEEAIVLLSDDGRILKVNQRACEFLDLFESELVGRLVTTVEVGGLKRFGQRVAEAVAEGAPHSRFEVGLAGAACEVSVHRGATCWVVHVSDVTATLAALYRQRELEIENTGLRQVITTAFDNLQVGIIVVDEARVPRYVNAYARTHIGDLMESSDPDDYGRLAGIYHPDGCTLVPRIRQPFWRALAGETVRDEEMVLHNVHTGRAVKMSANAFPLRDAAGNVKGVVGIFRHRYPAPEMQRYSDVDTRVVLSLASAL